MREPGLAGTCHKVFPCNFPFPWMKELRPRACTTPALPTHSITHALTRSLACSNCTFGLPYEVYARTLDSFTPPPPPVHDTPGVFYFFIPESRLSVVSFLAPFPDREPGGGFGVLTCTVLVQVTGIWNPNV